MKNKYQEALNEMYAVLNDSERWHEKKSLLQELVDKETPMKPIVEIYRGREVIGCGVCGEVVMDEYCTGCAQKLDWSDEDE